MNNMIFTILLAILFAFHRFSRRFIAAGKVKEAFCAVWIADTLFITNAVILSFLLYRYSLREWLHWKILIYIALYLAVTVIFLLITPSGFRLLKKPSFSSREELLLAEYRFNDTLGLVRNFFMVLLMLLPIALKILSRFPEGACEILRWSEDEICGAVCFILFLLLLPLCIRQTLFWLNALQTPFTETEQFLLQNYRTKLHYKNRNHLL